MFIYKPIEYYNVTTHELYKLFSYTDFDYSSSGINIVDSIAPQSSDISEIEKNSTYKYNFLRHFFYSKYFNFGLFSQKSLYEKQKKYILQENSRILSIPIKKIGKKIKQGSFEIIDNSSGSFYFTDDGCGNLINTLIPTESLVSDTNLKLWISFDDAYKYKEYPYYKRILTLQDNTKYKNQVSIINGTFSSGISGSGYKYDLNSNGYSQILMNSIDYNSSNFLISFWLKIPPAQENVNSIVLSKKDEYQNTYPFEIQVYNNDKLVFIRQGYKDREKLKTLILSSSVSLNDSIFHHIVFNKYGNLLNLYIDGVLNSSTYDYSGRFDTNNNCDIYIGARGSKSNSPNKQTYFSGSIDELRIYNDYVQPSLLYSNPFNTNIFGNIFYESGIIVLNNLSGSYNQLLKGSGANGFTISYRSVSELTEHEICVKKGIGEFNMSLNKSILKQNSFSVINEVSSSIAQSIFTPYITGIGLYSEKNELLAIAKICEPIKSIDDIDLIFKIKFDT